ncbi:hypothetical protein [Flammeovirga sp. SJP92]|uniref:hypothetical protein n=1 Tax=Flammeovirga sp. SJP92 TaxID=1775430 RepID=UPI000787C2AF|nr:hypothetical protein [Flammeovirga sp. SJP92]KXX71995.1 hypothetical protein AVL50_04215 [Flammeovirga sp. SJP92]
MRNVFILSAILLIFSGCNSSEEINTTLSYEATKGFHEVEWIGDDELKMVVFNEISDIGKGTITLPEGHVWPKSITVKLPFPRLEGFKAYTNLDKEHLFEHFHAAGVGNNQYIATYKGAEKKRIVKDEPFVEIELPHEMWADNPKIIYIEWVNLFRI